MGTYALEKNVGKYHPIARLAITTTTVGLWDLTFLYMCVYALVLNIHIDGCYYNNKKKKLNR
jgi:hypothetical protein